MELWRIGYGCSYYMYRQWLEGVIQVMLCAPWRTQKMAALCLSRAVEHNPRMALMLLAILEATQEKVRVHLYLVMIS